MKKSELSEIIKHFSVNVTICPYGEGHINDTYLAEHQPDKYILQKINHSIFSDPYALMENIEAVTNYLHSVIEQEGGDASRETIEVIKTTDGKNLYKTEDGDFYRMYSFVDDTITYQSVESTEVFYSSARAFGKFQKQLADFDASVLTETIPNFHNTPARLEQLKEAIRNNKAGRLDEVKDEIEFALAREKEMSAVVDAMMAGEIPLRVTHNDTKLNNVLFDRETDKAICVIDLDTVMPGSMLYDYGDSIRFGASSGAEDETDLSKIYCDLELFEAYTKGFLEELSDSITPKEAELLAFSAKLMTFECGIRFLADYLNGDTYFKIHRPKHNLDRCRTQFKLVYDMEQKMDQMNDIVKKYL